MWLPGKRRCAGTRRARIPRTVRIRLGLRRALSSQPIMLLVLLVPAAVVGLGTAWRPGWFTVPVAAVLLLLGGFLLRLRQLMLYYVAVAAVAAASWSAQANQPGDTFGFVVVAVLILVHARRRRLVGLQLSVGDSILVELRKGLAAQGVIPPLGPGWQCEVVLRAAYGDSFSGDFPVATRSADGRWLEIALVDVSGKGRQAGTRSLLLSGAFGGLLGALPPEEFLPAANRYLLRQQWPEGFATAIHVGVDLDSGAFRASAAGHPPAVHFRAGSGQWSLIESGRGPLLGVLAAPAYPAHSDVLEPGDALLLYTDGLVETRGGDIFLGIDRLVGQADRVRARGLSHGSAARIVDGTRSAQTDDRALVLIWRGS